VPKPIRMLVPIRAALAVLLIMLMLPSVSVCWALRFNKARAWQTQLFFKAAMRIFGIRATVEGALSNARPLLLVCNHASYLDTFVLGSLMPVSFTPKREVRSWPVIGFMCVLADCVFVERRRSHMQEARSEMASRIQQNKILCIFPEGTTNDGVHVKPFKSGFFSLAEEYALPVQPVTLCYTKLAGKPIPDAMRHHVAWVGEDTFFGHFLRFMSYASLEVQVVFHAPQHMSAFADRKALSQFCETTIAGSLKAQLARSAA
jgi:1-acyl-sn-glycerol-3-phosphate acyltransferase